MQASSEGIEMHDGEELRHRQHHGRRSSQELMDDSEIMDDIVQNEETINEEHIPVLKESTFVETPSELRKRRIKGVLWYLVKLLSGPLIALPFFLNVMSPLGATVQINRCAGITLWIAMYWILEPIPMSMTSMFPLILFPMLGVTSGKIIAEAYFSDLSFLFIGSFIIAIALERWNLHKRFALSILRFIGMRPRLILLGFMTIGGFISMWLSNSCTTAMLLPMANAVLVSIEHKNDENPDLEKREAEGKKLKRFGKSLFMCIAYSSSIMGMATLVGTPTNLVMVHVLNEKFPALQTSEDSPITFLKWFLFAFPLSAVFLLLAYIYFAVFFVRTISIDHHHDHEVTTSPQDMIRLEPTQS